MLCYVAVVVVVVVVVVVHGIAVMLNKSISVQHEDLEFFYVLRLSLHIFHRK